MAQRHHDVADGSSDADSSDPDPGDPDPAGLDSSDTDPVDPDPNVTDSSETYPSERRCPACDAPCVVRDGGCPTCHACGWSECAYSPP